MIPRYPGGKKTLRKKIIACFPPELARFKLDYTEPFIGGGSLLLDVCGFRKVTINDKDTGVADVYRAIKQDASMLTSAIFSIVPTVELWEKYKGYDKEGYPAGFSIFERAAGKVFLHACSHGGMGPTAGSPQGGWNQISDYPIGCRWNPEKWSNCYSRLGSISESWDVVSCDFSALSTEGFCYADPPYYEAGESLYLHHFKHEDHVRLRDWVTEFPSWVVSYDDCEPIRELYSGFNIKEIENRSVNNRNKEKKELIICKT